MIETQTSGRARLRMWNAVVARALLAAGLVLFGWAPAAAAAGPVPLLLAADDLATGDPAPPDDSPVPDGLDQPAPVPDDSVVEQPPTDPGVVTNANSALIAWIGTPEQRPADAALVTLQTALNTVPAGGTVSIDPNDYAFTGALSVSRAVTIDSASASMLYSRFTVSVGGLTLADDVTIGVASTGATISVTGSGVELHDITVQNPSAVARPTGIQLGAGVTGIVIEGFTMDGGGQASSYGVNLTTGSATITDPQITGVATGVVVTAAATTTGVAIVGGHITAATSGVSLGTSAAPQISGLVVTGPDAVGTGIDLANSSAAVVDAVRVENFSRGIGLATANAATGPTITDAVVVGASREGIALGTTAGPVVLRPDITGASVNQSTGILVFKSSGATIDAAEITGMMYGITTHFDNTGAGPVITSPVITAFGAVTLGSTQGARVTGAVLDAGAWGVAGTGINLVNAGRVTVASSTATGFLYGIGAQSSMSEASDRTDISISDITVVGAPDASSGVYLLGAVNPSISDVDADITGAALVIHLSQNVQAQDIVVHGHEGPTPVTGSAILRAYGSQGVHVDRASIDLGSYGFFYSGTDGATVTNATVGGVVERALYGRSVSGLEVSASSFTGNAAVGAFVTTTPEDGLSSGISIHDNTMTANGSGISVLQGTSQVQIERNTVSGQPDFVTAGGAHDLLIADNTVDQEAGATAIIVAPLWPDAALAESYSSSGIEIRGNTFAGSGTWVSIGTSDPADPAAERRTLRDPVLVTGNVFPTASTAVQTYANAVEGTDAAASVARALPVDGPIAVDARDYDQPNDWGSACDATGYLDGELYYDGGGAAVYELTDAPVLYPMTCLDLSLTQDPTSSPGAAARAGDLITWTLTPHNAGPRSAPVGWTVTQLLEPGFELVSSDGEGYTVDGATATGVSEIPAGADGPVLTVTVRVVDVPDGVTELRDVAYVSPAPSADLDEDGFIDDIVESVSPLAVPTIDTDTDASATDNDAQGAWTVTTDDGGSTGGEARPVAEVRPGASRDGCRCRPESDPRCPAGRRRCSGARLPHRPPSQLTTERPGGAGNRSLSERGTSETKRPEPPQSARARFVSLRSLNDRDERHPSGSVLLRHGHLERRAHRRAGGVRELHRVGVRALRLAGDRQRRALRVRRGGGQRTRLRPPRRSRGTGTRWRSCPTTGRP